MTDSRYAWSTCCRFWWKMTPGGHVPSPGLSLLRFDWEDWPSASISTWRSGGTAPASPCPTMAPECTSTWTDTCSNSPPSQVGTQHARFHFFTVKPRSTFADNDLIYRSGDHVGRRQFCGGSSRPTLARTPLRPLWQLQRPQTRWHHGRRRPFQIWRGRVCGVMAGGRKRGLFSAAPAPSLCILLVPRYCQSQVPGPSRVSEDKTVGVPEVPPCGGLHAVLQVSQTRMCFHRPLEGDVGAVQNYQPCKDPESL